MAKSAETPMMKQFNDFKRQYPDAVLLFRCGDFYETYCKDAILASEILGITPQSGMNLVQRALTQLRSVIQSENLLLLVISMLNH